MGDKIITGHKALDDILIEPKKKFCNHHLEYKHLYCLKCGEHIILDKNIWNKKMTKNNQDIIEEFKKHSHEIAYSYSDYIDIDDVLRIAKKSLAK